MLFNRISRAVLGPRRMHSAMRSDQTHRREIVSRQTTSLRETIEKTRCIAGDQVAEPEHLFCGILSQKASLAAVAAQSFGFEYEASVDQLLGPVSSRESKFDINSEMWSERSQLVFSLAVRETLKERLPKVDTEHLLLGIVLESAEQNSHLSRLLLDRSAEYSSVKKTVRQLRLELCSPD